jgi:hypothetical protein
VLARSAHRDVSDGHDSVQCGCPILRDFCEGWDRTC